MEQQLSLLVQLQEMDIAIRSLTEKKNRYPQMLESFDRRRSESKAELDKAKEALQAAQKNKRDRDKDLEAGAAKVEKLKARQSEIKTNKEYQALLKEIETAEQENKKIEEDILILMEKIDAATAAISESETRARNEEAILAGEQKDQEAANMAVEKDLQAALGERREKASAVQPALLIQYERLAGSRSGLAVAEARNEACSGCFMSIPPQVFVNVKKNEQVITCPNCGRILYFKEAIAPK